MRINLLLFSTFLIILTACSAQAATLPATPAPTEPPALPASTETEPAPTASPTLTETLSVEPVVTQAPGGPVVYGPNNFPAGINPLTGLPVSDPALLNRRPVSVKIQLFPRSQRPPMGVSGADLVFDYYQNAGMTRLHAIFLGQDMEQVGPIRSARLFDRQLVTMYKSVLAFGGADQRILETLFNTDFANRLVREGGASSCPPMCRIDPNGYNFLVTNTAEVTRYINSKGVDNGPQTLDGLMFSSEVPAGGQAASQLQVRFSISAYVRWDFDPASGRFLRFQDTQEDQGTGEAYAPLIDKMTGAQIAADNVVILLLPHQYAFGTKPGNSEIIEILAEGSGYGFAARDGQLWPINWHRLNKESVFVLSFTDGRVFPLKPGRTWFEIIGQSSRQESYEGGIWRFLFSIP